MNQALKEFQDKKDKDREKSWAELSNKLQIKRNAMEKDREKLNKIRLTKKK